MVYHESLSDILQKLNYQQRIPTIDDVKKEIINKAFHGKLKNEIVIYYLILINLIIIFYDIRFSYCHLFAADFNK